MSSPMTQPPKIFDRALRARRRDRAAAGFAEHAFAHKEAATRVAERLEEVLRSFPDLAILGAAEGVFSRAVEGRFGIERIRQFERSSELAAQAGAEHWTQDALPLDAASQDLVLSGLDLHADNDPVGTLIQIRRALRPDGLFIGVLFGGDTLAELRVALAEAETEIDGGLSPRVSPMAEIRDLGALLQRAGFALPVADSDRLTVWYPSPLDLMRDLRSMGETNALVDRRRVPLRRATLLRACEIYQQNFSRADGKVRATFELVFLTGWAYDASQPQPLRPGSAKSRLADALGVTEQTTGEKAGRS
ncbi:MAG: methyltransferase domain-containing protein [Pseudomonadota bacterium]